MKKIMFNDKYGLTQAVLEGRKTQTRRVVMPKFLEGILGKSFSFTEEDKSELLRLSKYEIGEEVAVAQNYKERFNGAELPFVKNTAGWNNKMFVKASFMSERIRITNVRVERLQDISDEDCLKEGVQETGFSHRFDKYFIAGIKRKGNTLLVLDEYGRYRPFKWQSYETPREAFAALIDKTCGKCTWDSNPYVFVYDFELIK